MRLKDLTRLGLMSSINSILMEIMLLGKETSINLLDIITTSMEEMPSTIFLLSQLLDRFRTITSSCLNSCGIGMLLMEKSHGTPPNSPSSMPMIALPDISPNVMIISSVKQKKEESTCKVD